MRGAGRRFQIDSRVGHDQVLRRNEFRDLASADLIEVYLLEGRAGQGQVKQHLVHARVVLGHDLHDAVVHEVLDAGGLSLGLRGLGPHDLRLDRALRGQEFLVGLSLELGHGLRDERVGDARCALKRL